jgi:Iron-containing redox enzyme
VSSLPPGQALRYKIRLAEPGLDALWSVFWEHPAVGPVFPEYLFSLWCSMRATVPLLQAAATRAEERAPRDPVCAELVPYFLAHAEEERGHDEWLLEDMAGLGIPRAEVLARLPPPDVAAMIGTQYYLIAHAHPIALLGCFAVLEGSPLTEPDLAGLAARSGIPRPLLRTLDKHALLDPHHRDDLDALLDALRLAPEHEALMGLSALTVVEQLGDIAERLLALAEAEPQRLGHWSPSA